MIIAQKILCAVAHRHSTQDSLFTLLSLSLLLLSLLPLRPPIHHLQVFPLLLLLVPLQHPLPLWKLLQSQMQSCPSPGRLLSLLFLPSSRHP